MNEYCFYIEINAPKGLVGIEKYIRACQMKLEPYVSGYNGKTILKSSTGEEDFEWSMDSSDSNILVATGEFFKAVDEAKLLIESLSYILSMGSFSHKWFLDDDEGNLAYSGEFNWERNVNT